MVNILSLTDPGVTRRPQDNHLARCNLHHYSETLTRQNFLSTFSLTGHLVAPEHSKDSSVYWFLSSAQWKGTATLSTCNGLLCKGASANVRVKNHKTRTGWKTLGTKHEGGQIPLITVHKENKETLPSHTHTHTHDTIRLGETCSRCTFI
jgi:hypothetical protein